MGLLRELALLPAAPARFPLKGTVWVAERIHEVAEDEFYNPAVIRRELEQVDELREAGQISEAEAEEWEEQLIDRLVDGRHRTGAGEGMA